MTTAVRPSVPPGPKGEPFIGNARAFIVEPLAYLQRCSQEYGDIVQIRLGTTSIYMLSHPDYIEQVLVTHNKHYTKSRFTQRRKSLFGNGIIFSESDFWLRQRRLMQPAFHHKRIASYGEAMVTLAERMAQTWQDGAEINIHEQMMELSLEIVVKTLFDTETTGDVQKIGAALDILIEQVSAAAVRPIQFPDWVPTRGNRMYNAALSELETIIKQIITEHRERDTDNGDLLSTLLHAQDEDGTRMTDRQVRDEVVNLYIAGHETVALALSFAWRLLAEHPEVEAKLHAELASTLGGRAPTIEDLPQLPYTEQVFSEALRLYPPVWGVFRDCKIADTIGGYPIAPGTVILLSPWVAHHDARFYSDPEDFRPERWDKQATSIPRYAYFPFGGGQRLCIGNIFAMVEARLLLATLAQQWRFTLVPDAPFELVPTITIRPKYGIKVVAHQIGSQ
ncbi:MAG TPA: cytochrome P450 [Ktedonobacteraceae bacterium]|nr:cytochrome P450 [Ktedonobacteraceae bacterium]